MKATKAFKTLFAGALLMMSASAMAQATYEAADGTVYTFRKHAFLQLQGGAQYTLGEAKFKDLISPNVQLGLGYQFNPWLALRLQANAWQSKGGWNGYVVSGKAPYTESYKWKYVAPGLDVMFNLSNLFCGWNPNRVLNVSAFLGAGANIAWDNDEVNTIAANVSNADAYLLEYLWDGTKTRFFGRAGLAVDFRVSDIVSLGLEGNANLLTDHYNSKKAGNPDWYFNVLAGIKINLGHTYTKKEPVKEPEPEPVKPYVAPAPAPAPEPVQEVAAPETITRNVFFTINSTKIVDDEMVKVKEIADFLNAHPQAKVAITGYADKGTGTAQINASLAERRAAVVVNTLKNDYGVEDSRITSDSKGDTVQPFAENDLNRVSICIVE